MKRLIIYLFALLLPLFSTAQLYHSIEIDANSFKPVHTDALTGVAIDKIEVDNSLRPCARIKLKVNRMTRADIENLQIKVMGGIHDVMKKLVAVEGNGLIIELTAKPQTRFYLHHDKYGDSNEVTLNLEGNKEYRLDAELCHMYSIVVSANLVGADVYVDNTYKGKIDSNHTLTISNVMAGSHNLRVEHGNLKNSQEIFVSDTSIHFRSNIKEEEPHYVVIEVSPKDAIVKINGKEYIPESGVVVTSLHNGTYSYSVSANNHHSESGTFVVNCKTVEDKFEKRIQLHPAYGWLNVSNFGALQDASVYVDGVLVGTTPISKHQLPSGPHTVRITKRLYKSHEAKVVISDNRTKVYVPNLVADFATVTLAADKGCEIYVNNSYKGTTLWSGDLPTGTYIFEARKESHRSATLSKTITAEPQIQSYTIPSPKPIYGSLNVITSPAIADVYVDGKLVGRTPLIHNLIIGNHTISVHKEGFDAFQQSVTITEGQRANLNLTLVEAKRQSTISYTTIYNSKVKLKREAFDAKVISHTYENGVGTILFNKQITKIGNEAFEYCYGLTSITIPNSVTSIGEKAFYQCDDLTSITIPNSVTSIGNSAFAYCGLTSIIIPNSVTSIGDYAFLFCSGLTSIIIPNSVTKIGSDAFRNCDGLTSVTIPNSVTSIGNSAFVYCFKLKEFKGKFASSDGRCLIVDGVLNSFAPSGLTTYAIPNSVTKIGDYAFFGCLGLTSITIPNSVTKIGIQAFSWCWGLTDITIPNSVKTIGQKAFYGCFGLTTVSIGSGVTSIGENAFYGCKSLTSVYCKATTPPTLGGSSVFGYNGSNRKIYVPTSSVSAYKSAYGWSRYASSIVSYNVELGNKVACEIRYTSTNGKIVNPYSTSAFDANIISNTYKDGCGVITFDKKISSIGNDAFYECRGLTSVTIPNSVTSIGERAFSDCYGLTSITIPNSVTSIGEGAFFRCLELKEFKGKFASSDGRCLIVKGVLNSFAGSGLTTYAIPNSVTSIGEYAFAYCGLTSITIPNSVTWIGNFAFPDCNDLTSVYCKATTPPTWGSSLVFHDDALGHIIYVPRASVSAYKSAYGWSNYASSIFGIVPTYTETISDLNMKMVWIEGGSFQMGASSEQSGKAESDEHPAHTVKIDSYYIAECEVTQAQWHKIMGYNPSQFPGNENHPVENVSWDEATQFCRKLSQLTGKKYVLPTEAQWEYAARGGNQSQGNKYSGNNDSQYVAWYDSNSDSKSHAVKQMLPNELGLYDMSGNVLEWCSDWYNEGYYRISAQNNPTGPTSGTHRVLRGGSWRGEVDNCRVSHRRHGNPTTRSSSIGFRVVCLSTNTNQSTTKTTSTAPSAKESTPDYGEAFVRVEQMPSFNGGTLETFRRWVMQNIQKPNSVKGRVFVQFIIERDGSLTNAKVLQSPHASLSNEALRVIKSSPKWTPGKQRGQAVRVSYTLPIDFR